MVSAPMLAAVSDSLADIMKDRMTGDDSLIVMTTELSAHNLELFREFVMMGTVAVEEMGSQVWSLSRIEVKTNDLNQVSSVSVLMTSSTALTN